MNSKPGTSRRWRVVPVAGDPADPAPERLVDLRVALVGYRDYDGGPRQTRVDVIDARHLRAVMSLAPADALELADQIWEVARWAVPDAGLAPDPGS